MSDKNSAQAALFAEIERQAKDLESLRLNALNEAAAVKDLSTAYRLVAGGPQPGGAVVNG